LLAAYRELVTERANSLVRKETTALRDIAKRYPDVHAREREIERLYLRFREAGSDYIRQSRRELREYLADGEEFESLLVRWEHERVSQIVEKEMSRWRT
jgi:hypothetical protein